jgi:hypothetical protein
MRIPPRPRTALRLALVWLAVLGLAAGCAHAPAPGAAPPGAAPTPVPPGADPLAEGLPADSLFYLRLDLAGLLQSTQAALAFTAPEEAPELVAQVGRVWRAGIELLARHGLRARLFERLFEGVLHVVLLADPEHGVRPALLLETEPALAEEFLVALRGYLDGRADRSGAAQASVPYRVVEVEAGELLEASGAYVGRLERYLVLAEGEPRELWAMLRTPAARGLADTELWGRHGRERPPMFFYGSVRAALENLERGLRRETDSPLELPEGLEGQEARQLEEAMRAARRAGLESYLNLRQTLSLDSLGALGGKLEMASEDQVSRARFLAEFHLASQPGRLLGLAMDSGRPFVAPGPIALAPVTWLFRVDPVGLFDELMLQAGPEASQRFQTEVDAQSQARLGYGVRALVGLLSGEFMLMYTPPVLPAPGEDAAPAGLGAGPPLFVLGIHDRAATRLAIDAAYAAAAAEPMLGPNLLREDYQGTELMVVNPGGGPSRDYAFALALLPRHLVVGGFREVTDLVRHSRGGEAGGPLAELLAARPGANLVLVVTQALLDWGAAVARLDEQADPLDVLREAIHRLPLEGEEPELAGEFRDGLLRVAELMVRLRDARGGLDIQPVVLDGRLMRDRYQLELKSEVRRVPKAPPAGRLETAPALP